MQRLIRVLFRANDNGQLFPVYFVDNAELESEIAKASAKLNAVETKRQESNDLLMLMEQADTLRKSKDV